ncbi:MAG: ABC transporter substrate-binding protein, partial [Proteobacteria bacterium]|nr:ABC transporter substrate-binding protein [Pseudomonadota bacterium]
MSLDKETFLRRAGKAAVLLVILGLVAPLASAAGQSSARGSAAGLPERVVSLVPSVTETLFALGAGDLVVGVSKQCDYPERVAALPRVGGFLAPVIERVVSLRPDLVITSPSPGNQSGVNAIKAAGIRVLVVRDATLEQLNAAILQVAVAVGRSDEGRKLVDAIDAELEAVRARVAGLPRPPVALVVGHRPLVLAGPAGYLGQLLNIARAPHAADEAGGAWPVGDPGVPVAPAPQPLFGVRTGNGTPSGDPPG